MQMHYSKEVDICNVVPADILHHIQQLRLIKHWTHDRQVATVGLILATGAAFSRSTFTTILVNKSWVLLVAQFVRDDI